MVTRSTVLVGLAAVAIGAGAVSAAEALDHGSAHASSARLGWLPVSRHLSTPAGHPGARVTDPATRPRPATSCGTVFDSPSAVRPLSAGCSPAVSDPIVLLPYRS